MAVSPKQSVRFTQINLHHSKDASAILRRTIEDCSTKPPLSNFVYLIQEPYIIKGSIRGLGWGKERDLFYNRNGSKPRAGIVMSKSLNGFPVHQLTTDDTVAVRVKLKTEGKTFETIIASSYHPIEGASPTADFIAVVDYCRKNRLHLLVGCDANAHNTCWGCPDNNGRGNSLLEFLSGTNLSILNRGTAPTFVGGGAQTIVDITLASDELGSLVKDWRVSDEVTKSDHNYILFKLTLEDTIEKQTVFMNPKRTNWDAYRETISSRTKPVRRINTTADLDKEAKRLTKNLQQSFNENCKSSTKRKGSTPWWNPELEKLRKQTRKAGRLAWNSRSEEHRLEYTRLLREFKTLIRKSKKESWRQFCEEMKDIPELSKLKKILTKTDCGQVGALRNTSGNYSQSFDESNQILLDCHFPANYTGEDVIAQNTSPPEPSTRGWKDAVRVVTIKKLTWAVSLFDSYKSPGPDNVYPILLQKSIDIVGKNLRDIMRASIALSYVPKVWRNVRVVFIPKPDKDYTEAKSFRPISLTSFILKTLERLVEIDLRDKSLLSSPLQVRQHAYTKGKSTVTALSDLVHYVERGLDWKKPTLAVFLDIQGAFDNAPYISIKQAARNKGVDLTLVNWIDSMLKQRQIFSTIGDSTKVISTTRGCPQGGVLSPLLWNLVVDSLLLTLHNEKHFAQAYADDVAILNFGPHLPTTFDRMQDALLLVENWCNEHGLSVNPNKTEMILFTRKLKVELPEILPKLYGTELKLTRQVKYLGVILDSKLLYAAHVEEQCKKAIRIMWALKGAVGKKWGLAPKQTLWLYTAIVRPIITYASVIWWERTFVNDCKKKLVSVQRLALMMVSGAMQSTPTIALEAMFSIAPLDIEVQRTARSTALRLWRNASPKPRRSGLGHMKILHGLSDEPTLSMPFDGTAMVRSFHKNFTVTIPKRSDWTEFGPKGRNVNELEIYTDGSVTSSGTGSGIHTPSTGSNVYYSLGSLATIFQAELYAILKAAEHLKEANTSGRSIKIYSDSQAVIKALSSPQLYSSLVIECIQNLNMLGQHNSLEIMWVPGHSDIVGNDKADELAKKGAELRPIGPEPILPICNALTSNRLKEAANEFHTERWRSASICKFGRLMVDKPDQKRAKYLLSLNRIQLKKVTEVLTGHCRLNRHLYVQGVKLDDKCPRCLGDKETAKHFIAQCPAFSMTRFAIFGKSQIEDCELHRAHPSDILRFISKTGRFT